MVLGVLVVFVIGLVLLINFGGWLWCGYGCL